MITYIKNGGLDSYERIVQIALSFNENYNIIEDDSIKKIEFNNPNFNKEKLEKLLQKFVKKSNYESFFIKHKQFYKEIVKKYKLALNTYIKFDEELLTKFYGFKKGNYYIILCNFILGSFGYCDNKNVISVTSINSIMNKEKTAFNPNCILNCFHEFSHSYINPLTSKYFKNIELDNLFDEAKKNGLEPYYYNQQTLINEYIVRAAQTNFSIKYLPKIDIDRQLEKNKKIGYKYINQIIELLDKKDYYSNFEEFYKNEIVTFFVHLNNKLKNKN